jgi:hypothetical protein
MSIRTRGFASPDYSGFAIIGLVELQELDIKIYEYKIELNANSVNNSNKIALSISNPREKQEATAI